MVTRDKYDGTGPQPKLASARQKPVTDRRSNPAPDRGRPRRSVPPHPPPWELRLLPAPACGRAAGEPPALQPTTGAGRLPLHLSLFTLHPSTSFKRARKEL
jgi:hypothetical protein